ncbi:MAG TPA: hypothetical protein PKO06_24625, partial [Candidatus Ozemobacteraceae bacterium]|nr:hypothetical protein [Candidatus Ozemobacteraceae bacterium]
ENGPGRIGTPVFLGRQPGDDLTIVGESHGVTFDGEHFKPLPSMAPLGITAKLTCAVFDDLNPANLWVGFSAASEGGVALQQGAGWLSFPLPAAVRHVAVSEPFLFLATTREVVRRAKR